ncbi:MAG TPA: ComF family protein [Verrucomicrobiota bacterium]|jgi:ComF family protein|nr:ComF family protein [Verrucomicrobiota bacterium]HRR63426.1 ComF family protein [Candidatus Paceibacterota bacterium]NLH85604.1 ComF family protein [Verrucomicrobiota bacterium]HNR69980.1 ComF family protein [Verrucomicrobiota bacterium]HNS68625.1 ComF family protein [Verrucomicrobiota bacterium]
MQGLRGFTDAVRGWLAAGLALVYPEVCQVCGGARAGPGDGYVCGGCQARVRFIEPPFCDRCGRPFEGDLTTRFECASCREMEWHFHSARSAVATRAPVLEIIRRYKYNRALWFEPFLAGLLIRAAGPVLSGQAPDLIIPVPLHFTKKREREFNQAESLAERLGAAAQIPVNKRLLRRVLPTRSQTRLSRQERLVNMRGAFAVQAGAKLNGERVVLVDDVFTTGATTNACARALITAGAGEVSVWTVARGI